MSGHDAGGTAPTPGPTAEATPGGVHLPADGAYLVLFGKVYAIHDGGAYPLIKASWRTRWQVTTDADPING